MNAIHAIALAFAPYFIGFIIILFVTIFILRLVGAWIFRINDVIQLQREILSELKRIKTEG
jgi:hypothetical protein